MKIFHLSDLHIGKQLYHYNMGLEQRDILLKISELAKKEKPDVVVIAGDIYDGPVPSAEAVSIFDDFLTALSEIEPRITILMIAGNHDSAKRIDFASAILARHQVYIAGLPPMHPEEHIQRVTLTDRYGEVDFYLLPFVKPSYVRKLFEEEITDYDTAVRKLIQREEIDMTRRNVIISHQFYTASGRGPATCDSEMKLVGGIENVEVDVLSPFEYAALGHIHRPQKMGKDVYRYCGTPLQYSVSESGDEKSITVVDLQEKGKAPQIETLPLLPMRKIISCRGTLAEIINQAKENICHQYVSITLTDEVEAYQPKEQLEEVYDHILEIRIDNARTQKLMEFSEEELEHIDPYESFCRFFLEMNGRELTEQENEMIQQIMNQGMEDIGQ